MRVKIKVNGHQLYQEYVGAPVQWTQSVELFGPHRTPFQVPAVVLAMDNGKIEILSLKTDLTWTEIEWWEG